MWLITLGVALAGGDAAARPAPPSPPVLAAVEAPLARPPQLAAGRRDRVRRKAFEQDAYQRAKAVSVTGEVLSFVALPIGAVGGVVFLVASTIDTPDTWLPIGAGMLAGAGIAAAAAGPMMAGGGMRMRTALAEAGVDVAPDLGWATWALVGGLVVTPWLAFVDPRLGFLPVLCYGGAVFTGAVFRGQLTAAHDRARLGALEDDLEWRVALSPLPNGLSVSLAW